MPTNTYTALATVTLGGSDNEIIFNSIPGTYRDLIVVFDGATTTVNVALRIRPNSDSANGNSVYMYGTGSSAASGTASNMDFFYTDSTSRYSGVLQIMDYSATDKHKTMLVRTGAGSSDPNNFVWAFAQRWASTSAITSLQLITSSSTITAGSTFSLFGIVS